MIWRKPRTRYRATNIVKRDYCTGGSDSNERPNRPLRVLSYLSDIATKSYTLICDLSLRKWVPTQYLWTITPTRIEHDWYGVIWRVRPFDRWRGMLHHRT
ncbi:hypothetical protein AVEN_245937-1 [Araneus ventricosus]|uniref:Uncharacterized protein n=1 Tax=Araneus ventricosus TaxID=182803 RepID=A0A4Y2W1F1_ARAVE|nr:hypothetical protein AVEN_245937-1 [Araneus ventricosus]